MGKVLRPQFEQFIHELKRGKALPMRDVGTYRVLISDLLEALPDLLINKASVTGHVECRLEYKCSWLGPAYDPSDIAKSLEQHWPGGLFPEAAREAHIVEFEEEQVVMRFGVELETGYLTGAVRIFPS